jgi:tRNA pseudouridine55 synthase
VNGVLVIDKPEGPTSHDVVALARRALGESRIGHTGTLDPLATGVLPLVIGRATRLASMLSGAAKTYEAGIRFGCATDTYDARGRILGDPDGRVAAGVSILPPVSVSREAVLAALEAFRGTFEQTPPPYSAKKIGGVPAYKLARRSREVAPAPVQVQVDELSLLGYDAGMAMVRVTASAGFYVRSLAHDLGAALGGGAHLASLRRTRAGTFGLDEAVTLDTLVRGGSGVADRIIPLDRLLPDVPAARIGMAAAKRVAHGAAVGPADIEGPAMSAAPGTRVRLVGPGDTLLALAEPRPGGLLQPVVVLV